MRPPRGMLLVRLISPTHAAARLGATRRHLAEETFRRARGLRLGISMFGMRVLVDMWLLVLGHRRLAFRLLIFAPRHRLPDLFAAIHPRCLIEAVWQAEIAGLLVRNHLLILQGMVRTAIAAVPFGVAHAN